MQEERAVLSSLRSWISAAALVVGAALLSVSACKGSTSDTPDGGGGGALATCSVDSECRTGFRCHRELHRCVCTSDSACPSGLYCNAFTGQCVSEVPGCTSDGQCAPSEYCEVSSRTCRKRRAFCEPCTEDVQCGASADRCIRDDQLGRSFCGKACSTDADCPDQATCQSRGGTQTCWPAAATCESLSGCNPDTLQSCTADAECTEGSDQVCDVVQGACVARKRTCPFGQVCDKDTHTCTSACTTDEECALDPDCENTVCRCTNNQCVPVAVCKSRSECQPGQVCVIPPGQSEGECRPSCTSDDQCPLGTACADPDGGGNRCVATCSSDADCALSENCSAARCVPGCQANEVCGFCERCAGTRVKQCTRMTGYCQTCMPPVTPNTCSPAGADWCCNLGGSGVLAKNCASAPCPNGFDCIDIGTLGRGCFPSNPSVCASPTCQ
ncbi:MAG: hypothetical protein D6729_19115 [Deltaproteobacteria bacterium]|nr:MAG: hypothetical protein D6729_19115 [Deltaproteobacteria bacterium]